MQNWVGKENVRQIENISNRNSVKSPQCKISPENFTLKNFPSYEKIIPVENPPTETSSPHKMSVYLPITNTIGLLKHREIS
jgi:hypothetical protein